MQPIEPAVLKRIRALPDFERRLKAHAESGNNGFDPFLVRNALTGTARKFMKSQGFSDIEINSRLPLETRPFPPRRMPTTGKVQIFALLIEFPDCPHVNSAELINERLFGSPSEKFPYESLAGYYSRSSYGKLSLSGKTFGWYMADRNRSEVDQTFTGRDEIIKKALNHFAIQGHDFARYDNNDDGHINYFMVFWSGETDGWGDFWWAYHLYFQDRSYRVCGKELRSYSWQPESWPVGESFSPYTVIHETGHALGLGDLYDYHENSGPKGGVGGADIMGGGWLDHNCFSKWILGWLDPTIISDGQITTALAASAEKGDCVVAWPGLSTWNVYSEFFMVQNRQRIGNDSSIPGCGLMIWHIDARWASQNDEFLYNNSVTAHKRVRLMEADGKEEIEAGGRYNAGDMYCAGTSFGPTTTPSSTGYDGTRSNVEVDDIVEIGTVVTARIAAWKGHPKSIGLYWKGLPESFRTGIDAALNGRGPAAGKCFFFKGDECVRFDWSADRVDPGYPKKIADCWHGLPHEFTFDIDCAINGRGPSSGKCLIFKRDWVVRYDWQKDAVDRGYPQKFNELWRNFPPEFTGDFDAITEGRNDFAGNLYFFKGDTYIKFNPATRKHGKLTEIRFGWHGLPEDFNQGIDAAIEGEGDFTGKSYLFKENQYVRYDWEKDRCE